MMASSPSLLLPAVRVAAAPASGSPARPLPVRVHLLLAARTPRRTVSVRCAHKAGGNFGGDPGPGGIHGPALDALRSAAVDAFRPLMDNFGHVFSMRNLAYVNDYNIGIPFGVAMACLGCYQLFKTDPWTFLDVVLGYAFYKLSVLSSDVHRRGFVNDFITKIKVAIVVIFLIKELPNNNPDSLAWIFIKILVFHLYLTTFIYAMRGCKQDARIIMYNVFEMLRCEMARILFGLDK